MRPPGPEWERRPPRRPDEGQAVPVLLVPRLLSDQHQGRVGPPPGEDGLGGVAMQVAAAAALHRLPKSRHISMFRDELPRAARHGSTVPRHSASLPVMTATPAPDAEAEEDESRLPAKPSSPTRR